MLPIVMMLALLAGDPTPTPPKPAPALTETQKDKLVIVYSKLIIAQKQYQEAFQQWNDACYNTAKAAGFPDGSQCIVDIGTSAVVIQTPPPQEKK